MQACQRRLQALIIACQTTETTGPGKATLHHPTLGQQDKAFLGFGQFDYFQANALRLGRLGQFLDLRALLLIGGRD